MWLQAQARLSVQLKNIDSRIKQPYTMHLVGLFNSNELPLPDLSTVAGTLCMSERTLNRRLLEEGVNYRQLKSEALISRAKQYLAHTDKSVEAIAADLGYQDAANFRRAFRKVTRHSPREYRSNYSPGDASGASPT
jgi:AraC-like DNA-binding protein